MIRDERGTSLTELLLVLAISGVIISALVMAIYQVSSVVSRGNSELGVQHDLQNAATWLNRDVLTASGASVDSPEDGVYRLTLEVPCLSTKAEVTTTIYHITYTYSEETGDLTRDSGDSSLTVARHLSANPFPPPGTVIDAPDSVTVTLRSREGNVSGEGTFALKMRAHKSGDSQSGDE
jgi:Tfp pilus assembly protein PilW